jgi:predicted ATPase
MLKQKKPSKRSSPIDPEFLLLFKELDIELIIKHADLRNWHNFGQLYLDFNRRVYIYRLDEISQSNLMDAFKFLHTVAKPIGGGLQAALHERGGIDKLYGSQGRDEDISISIELVDTTDSDRIEWCYELAFKSESKDEPRVLITRERITRNGEDLFWRPNDRDRHDDERLTQTFLEQVNENVKFRSVVKFLSSSLYLYRIPQILCFCDELPIIRIGGCEINLNPLFEADVDSSDEK